MEKRLDGMREEIRRLQNDSDRVSERLEALEIQRAQKPRTAAAPTGTEQPEGKKPELVSRPRLKVVRLSPDEPVRDASSEGNGAAPADERAPRVILKGQGKELELKQGG